MKRVVFLMLLALSPFVFSSCVPELDYPTWNIYLCFFVENNSTTPVIVEFYGQTEFGWGQISDTAMWNEYYPYLSPLEDADLGGGSTVSPPAFSVIKCRAVISPDFPRTEVFHLLWWDCDLLDENSYWGEVAIYNLRDTTAFSFTEYEEGMPFVSHVWRPDSIQPDPQINLRADYRNEFSITITDSNLSAMQKDYSMLEKFPQYYGGQGK